MAPHIPRTLGRRTQHHTFISITHYCDMFYCDIFGQLEVFQRDAYSYVLRYIPHFFPGSNFSPQPKPSIVLMREDPIISQFIKYEIQKLDNESGHRTTVISFGDDDDDAWGFQRYHPFIMQSVTKIYGHSLYKEGCVKLRDGLKAWLATPAGEAMLFGGKPHGHNKEVGRWEDVLVEGDWLPEGTEVAPAFLKALMNNFYPSRFPTFEQRSRKSWKPATVITFSDHAWDKLDDLVETGNEETLREMYETWVEKYECFKHM